MDNYVSKVSSILTTECGASENWTPADRTMQDLAAQADDEIERLQEAKRAALKVADERSKENVRLRAAIDFVRNRSARAGEILNEFDATFGVSSNIQ